MRTAKMRGRNREAEGEARVELDFFRGEARLGPAFGVGCGWRPPVVAVDSPS